MIETKLLPSVLGTIATKQGTRPIVSAAGAAGAPADANAAAFQSAAAANAAALRVSLCTGTNCTAYFLLQADLRVHPRAYLVR